LAEPAAEMSDNDRLKLYVDLFKYYLELMLKVDVFVAAVVGGIMAFAITKVQDSVWIRAGLFMVPAGLSLALGIVAARYIGSASEMYQEIQRLGKILKLTPPPHVHLLVDVTVITCVGYFLLGIGIVLIAIFSPIPTIATPK
jgi:hypothetical protein